MQPNKDNTGGGGEVLRSMLMYVEAEMGEMLSKWPED
jgi:hypothetical protein